MSVTHELENFSFDVFWLKVCKSRTVTWLACAVAILVSQIMFYKLLHALGLKYDNLACIAFVLHSLGGSNQGADLFKQHFIVLVTENAGAHFRSVLQEILLM